MGCDVHMVAQIRQLDGGWDTVDERIFVDQLYVPTLEPDPCIPALTVEPYSGRNYSFFGMLAGVRNEDGVEPISNPRGLPDGFVSPIYLGDHSFSWLLLSELEVAAQFYSQDLRGFGQLLVLLENLRYLTDRDEDVRVVFGFDS